MINPFYMLPLLGVLGLKARDLIGFSFVQLLVHAPLVPFFLEGVGGKPELMQADRIMFKLKGVRIQTILEPGSGIRLHF